MLCSSCGAGDATTPCSACGSDPLLDGRYRLDALLGHGGSGVTYRATRLTDGLSVCVKELAFHRMQSFEAERLFKREAAVLRQLRHSQIPAYLDDFTAGAGKALSLYLVQELVDGVSLADELRDHRYTEAEVLDVLAELLDILVYLQNLRPPVIHRDLKPSNVLRRRSDGRLVLIDFGAVKDTAASRSLGGATVAGTFGFMAPEQLYGRASEASDLYAVGVIGVVLLSQRDPADLIGGDQRLDWRPHVVAAPPIIALLDRLTRPDPTQRPADAVAARAQLEEVRSPPAKPPPSVVSLVSWRSPPPLPTPPMASGRSRKRASGVVAAPPPPWPRESSEATSGGVVIAIVAAVLLVGLAVFYGIFL